MTGKLSTSSEATEYYIEEFVKLVLDEKIESRTNT